MMFRSPFPWKILKKKKNCFEHHTPLLVADAQHPMVMLPHETNVTCFFDKLIVYILLDKT